MYQAHEEASLWAHIFLYRVGIALNDRSLHAMFERRIIAACSLVLTPAMRRLQVEHADGAQLRAVMPVYLKERKNAPLLWLMRRSGLHLAAFTFVLVFLLVTRPWSLVSRNLVAASPRTSTLH